MNRSSCKRSENTNCKLEVEVGEGSSIVGNVKIQRFKNLHMKENRI